MRSIATHSSQITDLQRCHLLNMVVGACALIKCESGVSRQTKIYKKVLRQRMTLIEIDVMVKSTASGVT